jgi:hypothetical protein
MNKFTFTLDRKVTMWVREYHEIEAETQEEANQKFIQNIENHDEDNTFLYEENLTGTMEWTDEYELLTQDGTTIHQS